MSRSKDYQKMLNSIEWKKLRALKLRNNTMCQMCLREGYISAAVDVHHIQPVESGRGIYAMRLLCFDYNNLMSLCVACHSKIHKEMQSHTAEAHKQRESDRMQRWIDKNSMPYGEQADEYLSAIEELAKAKGDD